MTKEELKQEAEEWLNKWELCNKCQNKVDCVSNFSFCKKVVLQSYLASAKPREKEIKVLGERCLQLQKDKGELIDKVRDLEEKLANADYQLEGRDLEIKELEAQIEKMKCCYNCANDTLEPPEVISNGVCENCINHSKWELEN